MNHSARLLIAATLLFGSGCAKSDWIDRTLVTVDVTGTWTGSVGGASAGAGVPPDPLFELEQQGSMVEGFILSPLAAGNDMKAIVGLLAVATLAIASGCAKTDWIESTLVTVDLTGVWQGTFTREGAYGPGSITLTLQQGGSKVTGQVVLSFSSLPGSRSVEGTINGDMFRFRTQDGRLTGELQVSGDEMKGTGQGPAGQLQYSLRR